MWWMKTPPPLISESTPLVNMTPRQKELYVAIQRFWDQYGHGPSVDELQEMIGAKSRGWVYSTMMKLVERGYCTYLKNQHRSIRPVHG
jgi:SOS-response transcriptional repressor LexA